MKIDKTYTQVTISKDNKTQTIYIPSRLAIRNTELRVQNNSDKFEYGWIVSDVYPDSVRNDIPNVAQIIRRHRDNTLDSQHKIIKEK